MIEQCAAYDILDHDLLPKKLKEYNFDEASIEWIQCYLGEWKQCVQTESKTSELLDCVVFVNDNDSVSATKPEIKSEKKTGNSCSWRCYWGDKEWV